MSSPADSTFDSGQGSTVYSDSQSSQQSMVLSSLVDTAPTPASCICSPPVSEGPGLTHSLPALGAFQQQATVVSLGATAALPSCPLVQAVLSMVRFRLAYSWLPATFPLRDLRMKSMEGHLSESCRTAGWSLRCEEVLGKECGASGNRP